MATKRNGARVVTIGLPRPGPVPFVIAVVWSIAIVILTAVFASHYGKVHAVKAPPGVAFCQVPNEVHGYTVTRPDYFGGTQPVQIAVCEPPHTAAAPPAQAAPAPAVPAPQPAPAKPAAPAPAKPSTPPHR